MSRRIAFPFLTLSESAVEATGWRVSLDGVNWSEAGEFLPDWDGACSVHLKRTVMLLPDVVPLDLGLRSDDCRLAVGFRIGTGQGRLPRLIVARGLQDVNLDEPICSLESVVPGRILSGVIDLRTEVTLARRPTASPSLSPSNVGDRLWSDSWRVSLEGGAQRFPIEAADLSTLLGDAVAGAAPWHLHWTPRDWDRDFHGAIRLYLNENATEFLNRIQAEDLPTLQVLLADIITQLCESFLADKEASESMTDADPSSLAAQVSAWLGRAWPGKDVAFIRSVLEVNPGVFRSTLLALAEPGDW